jgi:hypothetical protein
LKICLFYRVIVKSTEPEIPEEPGPGDESELIEDDAEFDVVDEIYDDDL